MLALFAGLIGGGWYVAVTYGDQIMELVKAPFSAITAPPEEKREQPAAPPAATPGAGSSLSNTVSVLTAQSSPPDGGGGDVSAVPTPIATNDSPASAGVNASSSENATENSIPQADTDATLSPDDDVPVNQEVSIPGGRNRLVIRAHAECWIRSRADNRVREFTVRPGAAFAITYNDRLEITFGNAGGVSLSHNGEELGVPGAGGRTVVVRFPQ